MFKTARALVTTCNASSFGSRTYLSELSSFLGGYRIDDESRPRIATLPYPIVDIGPPEENLPPGAFGTLFLHFRPPQFDSQDMATTQPYLPNVDDCGEEVPKHFALAQEITETSLLCSGLLFLERGNLGFHGWAGWLRTLTMQQLQFLTPSMLAGCLLKTVGALRDLLRATFWSFGSLLTGPNRVVVR